MQRLQVLFRMILWLYSKRHPNGVRGTINKREDGQEWFLVEPAKVWLFHHDNGVFDHEGNRYTEVGGGSQAGKYVQISSANCLYSYGDENDQ